MGAELILEYGRSVPDMSAEDLMHDLNYFLDFSKEHSAAVDWVESLPPQFKQAIKDHAALEADGIGDFDRHRPDFHVNTQLVEHAHGVAIERGD